MEALQLNVLDLPAVNPLEILPRFGIRGKDAEAIAQFAEAIGEIRLDQLESQRVGNGKSAKQLQPNLPITIKVSATEAINPREEYIDQFQVGDRVKFRDGYRSDWKPELRTGTITKISEHSFEVFWDDFDAGHFYTKHHINCKKWWIKKLEGNNSGICDDIANIPELTHNPRKHGCIETYFVKGSRGKPYEYQRYVYLDAGKVYRHHHIPQKQTEAIAALWAGGASSKEICTALGKECKSK